MPATLVLSPNPAGSLSKNSSATARKLSSAAPKSEDIIQLTVGQLNELVKSHGQVKRKSNQPLKVLTENSPTGARGDSGACLVSTISPPDAEGAIFPSPVKVSQALADNIKCASKRIKRKLEDEVGPLQRRIDAINTKIKEIILRKDILFRESKNMPEKKYNRRMGIANRQYDRLKIQLSDLDARMRIVLSRNALEWTDLTERVNNRMRHERKEARLDEDQKELMEKREKRRQKAKREKEKELDKIRKLHEERGRR